MKPMKRARRAPCLQHTPTAQHEYVRCRSSARWQRPHCITRRTTRAPEKSRTSTERFTGPLHYRYATGAREDGLRATSSWSRSWESHPSRSVWRTDLSLRTTGLVVPRRHRCCESPWAPCGTSSDSLVPPSGVEPDPPGTQPSALTTCARAGYEARRTHVGSARAARFLRAPHARCVRRRSSSSSLQLSESRTGCAGRTFGVDVLDIHSSASIAIRYLYCRYRVAKSVVGLASDAEPETPKGHLVFPGGPSSNRRVSHVNRVEDLRRYPYIRRRGRC